MDQKDFKLEGFNTIFHKKVKSTNKTRIICLVRNEVKSTAIKISDDLMSDEFPSIWLEICGEPSPKRLVCGFYREWSDDETKLTIPAQTKAIKILTKQIETADAEGKLIIISWIGLVVSWLS